MSQQIESIDELKKHLVDIIKKDVKEFKVLEGSGLLPYKINRTSEILEKIGVKVFTCKFCDIKYPEGLMWQISGRPLCIHCKETIKTDKEERKYH